MWDDLITLLSDSPYLMHEEKQVKNYLIRCDGQDQIERKVRGPESDVVPGSPTLKQGRTNQENVSNTGCAPGARDGFAFAVEILPASACSAEPARQKALIQITPLRGLRQTAFDQFLSCEIKSSAIVSLQPTTARMVSLGGWDDAV